ncbi:hypothetical protein D9C73_002103 [Collichthys lucidus]|uniref:Uncharacterized protein n=1 Tax=Collichthys lucidus TaxID=240159 RepID=A0A4U5U1V9_COLLU|nr:hypothetical protein D9C73_002103 [Collichthys lucidus]
MNYGCAFHQQAAFQFASSAAQISQLLDAARCLFIAAVPVSTLPAELGAVRGGLKRDEAPSQHQQHQQHHHQQQQQASKQPTSSCHVNQLDEQGRG